MHLDGMGKAENWAGAFHPEVVSGILPVGREVKTEIPAYATSPNGPWLMLFRACTKDPAYGARSGSRDRGRTWSSPQIIGSEMANHGLLRLPDCGLIDHGIGTGGVKVRVSYDEGLTWDYEQPLEPSGDCAMSSLALDESTVFVVHSSAMGDPYRTPAGISEDAYYVSGLRGRWIWKV